MKQNIPGDLETQKRPVSCKIEIHFWFRTTQYLFNDILDFYLKFVPDIHFPVQVTGTKFPTVSQKNQGVTSD
jgi:hypothetical protein